MTSLNPTGKLLSYFIIKYWNTYYSSLSNYLPELELLIDISCDNKTNNIHLHQKHHITGSGYCVQYIALSKWQNLDYVVPPAKST